MPGRSGSPHRRSIGTLGNRPRSARCAACESHRSCYFPPPTLPCPSTFALGPRTAVVSAFLCGSGFPSRFSGFRAFLSRRGAGMPGRGVSRVSGALRGPCGHCVRWGRCCAQGQRLRPDLREQSLAQARLGCADPASPGVQPLADHPMLLRVRRAASEPMRCIPACVAGEGQEFSERAAGLLHSHAASPCSELCQNQQDQQSGQLWADVKSLGSKPCGCGRPGYGSPFLLQGQHASPACAPTARLLAM
jgi:hypothetical protein